MSSPNRKRFKLAEMRDQSIDALGMVPGLDIELEDGGVVTVPNPLLASDDVNELVAANKIVDAAKAILGEEDHAALLAGGGHSADVLLAWRLMQADLEKDSKSS